MRYHKDMTEEDQLADVKENGHAIWDIIRAGIVPSEAVQLAAVEENSYSIAHILDSGITPSEVVQIASIKYSRYVMQYIIASGIITPSKAVEDAYYLRWLL